MNLTEFDKQRFWSGIDRREFDDCWSWQRSCDSSGYGYFWLNGKGEQAHRISWFLSNGQIPDLFENLPSQVCHRYDNPPCCNPRHLFLGNVITNQKDASAKGRLSGSKLGNRGQNNGRAGLTELQAKEIKRHLLEDVLTQQQIADIYGVTRQTITQINAGKTWFYVSG